MPLVDPLINFLAAQTQVRPVSRPVSLEPRPDACAELNVLLLCLCLSIFAMLSARLASRRPQALEASRAVHQVWRLSTQYVVYCDCEKESEGVGVELLWVATYMACAK